MIYEWERNEEEGEVEEGNGQERTNQIAVYILGKSRGGGAKGLVSIHTRQKSTRDWHISPG